MDAGRRAMARAHRRALMRKLPDGLVVMSAAKPAHRNGDQSFRYRQDSSFLWLTGIEEPGYALVLDPRRGEEWLFCPRPSQKHAVWLGRIPSLAQVRRETGVARTAFRDEMAKTLSRLAGRSRHDERALADALAELRIVKDEDEIRLLSEAS